MEGFEKVRPEEIEKRSFELITEALEGRTFQALQEPIIKRCIHTSADFDYADSLVFSPQAVEKALAAIKAGSRIITDTNMGMAGVNKMALEKAGCEIYCHMAEEDVAMEAKEKKMTRATASMRKAARYRGDRPLIFAVGNAPTALVQLYELIAEGKVKPALIIGVPVGFVNVVAAKELIMTAEVPYIVARGRKGGSNIAAAILNALLYMVVERS